MYPYLLTGWTSPSARRPTNRTTTLTNQEPAKYCTNARSRRARSMPPPTTPMSRMPIKAGEARVNRIIRCPRRSSKQVLAGARDAPPARLQPARGRNAAFPEKEIFGRRPFPECVPNSGVSDIEPIRQEPCKVFPFCLLFPNFHNLRRSGTWSPTGRE